MWTTIIFLVSILSTSAGFVGGCVWHASVQREPGQEPATGDGAA